MKPDTEGAHILETHDHLQLLTKIQQVLDIVNVSESKKQLWGTALRKLQNELNNGSLIPNFILHQCEAWEKLTGGSGEDPIDITPAQVSLIEHEIHQFLDAALKKFGESNERIFDRNEVVTLLDFSFEVQDDLLWSDAAQMRETLLEKLSNSYSRKELELASLFHKLGGSTPKTDLDSNQSEITQKINNEISAFVMDQLQPLLRVTKL